MKPTCVLLTATLGLALASPAEARTWSAKPLLAIVPTATGSIADVVPRIVLEQLSRQLGQSIIVENRTGAGGTIAAAFVAKSEPDGYTFLVHSVAHTIAPAFYPNLSYDPPMILPRLFRSAFPPMSWSSRAQAASKMLQT